MITDYLPIPQGEWKYTKEGRFMVFWINLKKITLISDISWTLIVKRIMFYNNFFYEISEKSIIFGEKKI